MLPEPQQRRLAEIEDQLRQSDSQLSYRFSLFAELVAGEEMPHRERLPVTLRGQLARLLARLAGRRSPASGGVSPSRALLLLPALIAVIMCTLLLVATRPHGGTGCGGRPSAQSPAWIPGCAQGLPYGQHR